MIIKYDIGKKSFTDKVADKGKKYINHSTPNVITTFIKKTGLTIFAFFISLWNLPFTKVLRKGGYTLYQTVPWIHILVVIIREGAKLWKKYFAEFLSVFAITFLTLPFLILLFERNPIVFFLFLLPIAILNTVVLSALYRYIDQNEAKQKTSLRQCIQYCFTQLIPITLLIAFYCFFITAAVLLFLGLSWAMSWLLTNFHINWFQSYYYWLTTLSGATFLASLVFLLTLLAQHVYYSFLLDKANPLEDANRILPLMKQYYVATFPLFFLLILLFIPMIFWLSISYLDVGVGFLLLLIFHATFLFSYLLRKRLWITPHSEGERSKGIPESWFVVGFIFGTFSYVLCMLFTLSYHSTLIQFINRIQQDRVISQELITYMNAEYGYTIDYPRSWSVYTWQPNVTTLFDNNTGTFIGGIWVNMTVTYAKNTNYQALYAAKNATQMPSDELNVKIQKRNNFEIDGHKGVSYTLVRSDFPLSEYETNYMIKKGNVVYSISFLTKSRDIEADNTLLFEKMIDSFRFVK